MNLFKRIFWLHITLISFGCSKDTSKLNKPDVYISGNTKVALYWKNGNPVLLSNDTTSLSGATGIFISGNNIYVSGWDRSGAKFWKDGEGTSLDGDIANAITVLNQDVYMVGSKATGKYTDIAMYWKNGIAIPLTSGTTDERAGSVAISGADVYVAGNEIMWPTDVQVAKYWKNGNAVILSDIAHQAEAYSMIVSNGDVYVTGREQNQNNIYEAKYWKNGIPVLLSDPTIPSIALSIAIYDSDVYVIGYEDVPNSKNYFSIAKYWKNGSPIALTDGTTRAYPHSIAISKSGDVYVVGQVFDTMYPNIPHATLWKNGTTITLDNTSTDSYAYSIFLVE